MACSVSLAEQIHDSSRTQGVLCRLSRKIRPVKRAVTTPSFLSEANLGDHLYSSLAHTVQPEKYILHCSESIEGSGFFIFRHEDECIKCFRPFE